MISPSLFKTLRGLRNLRVAQMTLFLPSESVVTSRKSEKNNEARQGNQQGTLGGALSRWTMGHSLSF